MADRRVLTATVAAYPRCWCCNARSNALSGDADPCEGDLSLCNECIAPSIISFERAGLELRQPRPGEWGDIYGLVAELLRKGRL